MSESLVLTTPIVPPVQANTLSYTVRSLLIERKPYPRILVVVESNDGERVSAEYNDAFGFTTAATLISGLNTANLTIKSLQKRILERLAADGFLPAGAVAGVPD